VTGFSSHVDLAGVGTIRQSHQMTMIVRAIDGSPLEYRWMRLRATALERVMVNSWAPRGATLPPVERGGLFWLHGPQRSLDDTVELEIELLRPRRYLFQPEGTVAVASPIPVLLDPSGGMVLAHRVHGPITYTVWVARSQPPYPNDPPRVGATRFPLHPEARRLTDEIVAEATTDLRRVEAIESYLQENFEYSLRGMSHLRADPVTWFLLEERAGHCEYFAGAMVAMLDELDIPARLVAGYSGGELLAGGSEAVIRESNAHSWVEVKLGRDRPWIPFDPTPAGEVPMLSRRSGRDLVRFSWDWVQTRWDRYVLTFGLGEQMLLMTAAAEGFDVLARELPWRRLSGMIAAAALVFVAFWWWRRHGGRGERYSGPPAAAAVQRLAERLQADGIDVPPRATVRWVARRAAARWPAAAPPLRELAFRAERELYAVRAADTIDRAVVRQLWAQAQRAIREHHGPESRR
jgi:transglutaminase-like putative cysteine protease